VILLCTSPDLTQEIVPFSQYSLLVRDGVEPDFVSAQNSDTVLILKSSGNVNLSISASVRFIKAPLPTFFWIEAVPTATKLSFTGENDYG